MLCRLVATVAVLATLVLTPGTGESAAAECNTLSSYDTQMRNNVYLIDQNLSNIPGWSKPQAIQAVQEALMVWNQQTEGPYFVYEGLGTPDMIPNAQSPCRGACPEQNTIEFRVCDGSSTVIGQMLLLCRKRTGFCLNPGNATRWHVWICANAGWVPASATAPYSTRDLTSVLVHELGHTLGLGHPGPTGPGNDAYCDGEASVMGNENCPLHQDIQPRTRMRRPYVYDRECVLRKSGYRHIPIDGVETTFTSMTPLSIQLERKGTNVSAHFAWSQLLGQSILLKIGSSITGGLPQILQSIYNGSVYNILKSSQIIQAHRASSTQTPIQEFSTLDGVQPSAIFSHYTPQSDFTDWEQTLVPTVRTSTQFSYLINSNSFSSDRVPRFAYINGSPNIFLTALRSGSLGYDIRRYPVHLAPSSSDVLLDVNEAQTLAITSGALTAPGVACEVNGICRVFYISADDQLRYIRVASYQILNGQLVLLEDKQLKTLAGAGLQSVSDIAAWSIKSSSNYKTYFAYVDSQTPGMHMHIGILDSTTERAAAIIVHDTAISGASVAVSFTPLVKLHAFWTTPSP